MSLRAFSRALPRAGVAPASRRCLIQTRLASSDSHHDHHDSHAEQEVYPAEGFSLAFWRRTIVIVGAAAAFYQFAPSSESTAEKINALTEALTLSPERTKKISDQHLLLAKQQADSRILTDGATMPVMRRLRNPG
ncbi:hypothetical protein RhiJN_07330 [Ceratobasidium sp. AG-Ba]|nr:hypothetical protein RhiJN_07330 [Ceratobasidium sp. AG-Ba]QRW08183.1 hypothetical protein RhiLY_07182 [Ceratobasidium sp. AG-Ba]